MRKVNLFIPGFAKSGTSSLHEVLTQHSEISGGKKKEPHVFAKSYSVSERHEEITKLFDLNSSSKYILDSSTSYMMNPHALQNILEYNPSSKFIIIARDPIDRIVSHFNWLASLGLVEHPFHKEIKMDQKKYYNFNWHYGGNYKSYIQHSLYGKQLSSLFGLVDRNQVLFLTFEKFISCFSESNILITNFLEIKPENLDLTIKNQTNEISNRNPLPRYLKNGRNKFIVNYLKSYLDEIIGKRTDLTPRIIYPKYHKVTRKEVWESVIDILQEDIKILKSLELDISQWPIIDS